ncbi:MAG: lysophospholipase [Caulobacteraceae bacterium]
MASRPITPFTLEAFDGAAIAAYRSLPFGPAKGIVQIAHGMAEHFGRYAPLTQQLTAAGFAVYGADHRGHGASAGVHGMGDFGSGGFQSLVDDMAALTGVAKAQTPGRPLALLGHSMGSFAAQLYLLDHSAELAALVLCGTAALDKLLEAMLAGGGAPTLGSLNAAFEPARTPFDWLSRDAAQVDAYLADPLCGIDIAPASTASLFTLGAGARIDPRLADVRPDLPILVLSGERDPVVGPDQAFARALIDGWRAAGLNRIDHRIYPDARHELFNETCRAEVEADLIAWLDEALAVSRQI